MEMKMSRMLVAWRVAPLLLHLPSITVLVHPNCKAEIQACRRSGHAERMSMRVSVRSRRRTTESTPLKRRSRYPSPLLLELSKHEAKLREIDGWRLGIRKLLMIDSKVYDDPTMLSFAAGLKSLDSCRDGGDPQYVCNKWFLEQAVRCHERPLRSI